MAASDRRIRVLVTAGSAVAANQLAGDLANDRSLEVSFATTLENLWREIETARPVALLLDMRIAGVQTPELVRRLVQQKQLPILIRTDPGEISSGVLLDALEGGALGVLTKPASADEFTREIPALIWSLKAAAGAAIANLPAMISSPNPTAVQSCDHAIIAIGAGMGGFVPLTNLLMQLPAGSPAAVVIAPLPAQLISAWAARLSSRCPLSVKPAKNGDFPKPGQVLVAPGNGHLLLRRSGSDWIVRLKDGPAVFQNKPSIEMLFTSIAESGAAGAVGALLSGGGVDGIAGLLQLRKAGGRTVTDSPQTSLFPDLPTRALQCGAAEACASPGEMANTLIEFATQLPAPGVAA